MVVAPAPRGKEQCNAMVQRQGQAGKLTASLDIFYLFI
jgi:hypothetical protein